MSSKSGGRADRPALRGRTVAVTEHRFERELGTLVERLGATVISCPLLEECLVGNQDELRAFVRLLIDPGVDMMVFFTGVGFRLLYDQSVAMGCGEPFLGALRQTRVVSRGDKPRSALRKAGIRVDISPEEATSNGLLSALRAVQVRGLRVGVQLYGVPNPEFTTQLEALGAEVLTVQVYDYRPVVDAEQVEGFTRQLIGGSVDAITFTSAPQVRSLFGHARALGMAEDLVRALNEFVVVVAVGPVTRRALEERGIVVRVMPTVSKMGPMVEAMADYLSRASR